MKKGNPRKVSRIKRKPQKRKFQKIAKKQKSNQLGELDLLKYIQQQTGEKTNPNSESLLLEDSPDGNLLLRNTAINALTEENPSEKTIQRKIKEIKKRESTQLHMAMINSAIQQNFGNNAFDLLFEDDDDDEDIDDLLESDSEDDDEEGEEEELQENPLEEEPKDEEKEKDSKKISKASTTSTRSKRMRKRNWIYKGELFTKAHLFISKCAWYSQWGIESFLVVHPTRI